MRGGLAVLVLALVGLCGATSIGYAAYLVSRDSVGSPVTKLTPAKKGLAPAAAKRKKSVPARPTSTPTPTVTTPRTTTVDDHGGRGRDDRSGKGSDGSGHGGRGGDD